MGNLKDMDSIIGMMKVFIKVIFRKVTDMDLVYGKTRISYIRDIIMRIRKRVMESMYGKGRLYIKVDLRMIKETDMVNCILYLQHHLQMRVRVRVIIIIISLLCYIKGIG
jgi:hypothetical protein